MSSFFNLPVNRWSLYDPAATYFLPVNELSLLYINGLLEILGEENAGFILEALGFRTARMPATRYLGMGWLTRLLARLFRTVPEVTYGLGLEGEAGPLLTPYCPPFHPSMEAAVRAVVELKHGRSGIFRGGAHRSAWREPSRIVEAADGPSEAAIAATVAYCTYVYARYGRFPAYQPAFRTLLGFQANHLDTGFYDRHYRPEALGERQREHMRAWHPSHEPRPEA